ncbi:MAG: porin, partial [Parasutterella excrementihominis]
MKKLTLALLSVLAFGSAAAAQDSVTVYGRIDLGVGISRINDGFGSKENNAQMVTG